MSKRFVTVATIKGGQLHIPNKAEMDEFYRKAKDGTKVLVELIVYEQDASILAKVYFKKAIVPAFQRGFKALGEPKSEFQTLIYLFGTCPYTNSASLQDIGADELSQLIDWSKQHGAEHLGIYIAESKYLNE